MNQQKPRHRVNVVVKYLDTVQLPDSKVPLPEKDLPRWNALVEKLDARLAVRRVFTSVSMETIEIMTRLAQNADSSHSKRAPLPRFENFLWLTYTAADTDDDTGAERELADVANLLTDEIASWASVEMAYVRLPDEDACPPPPLTPPLPLSDPEHPRQSHQQHLLPSPAGLNVLAMWALAGGDGAGQHFVDIERGWFFGHADLLNASGTQRVMFDNSNGGENLEVAKSHGTSVLGIVGSTRNHRDVVGMAHNVASMSAISYYSERDKTTTADGLMLAGAKVLARRIVEPNTRATSMFNCNVLLLEAQARLPSSSYAFPVEVYPETFAVIQLLTQLGVTVIEPAGNGWISNVQSKKTAPRGAEAVDLDRLQDFIKRLPGRHPLKTLKRDAQAATRPTDTGIKLEPFQDSGAIMVSMGEWLPDAAGGAGSWKRQKNGNFGSRIDCFAAGQAVSTLQYAPPVDAHRQLTELFGGTSSASAIIAGAALCVQGVAQAKLGAPLGSAALRAALSDARCGTASVNGASDKIGTMPDLVSVAKIHVR